MVPGPQLRGKLRRGVDIRIDVATQSALHGRQRPGHIAKGYLADDHDVHITRRLLLTPRQRPKDERRPDVCRQWPQRRRDQACRPHGLEHQPAQFLIDRRLHIRSIKNLPSDFPAEQYSGPRQRFEVLLDRPEARARKPHHPPHMKLLVRAQKQ